MFYVLCKLKKRFVSCKCCLCRTNFEQRREEICRDFKFRIRRDCTYTWSEITSVYQLVCFYVFACNVVFILERNRRAHRLASFPPFAPPPPPPIYVDLCIGKKSVSITLINHVASTHFSRSRYTCKINSCQIDDLRHCLSHLLFENCRVIYEKVIKVLIHLPR